MITERLSVASLVWQLPSQLHELQGSVVESLGHRHTFARFDEPLPPGADVVLVQGPYGSLRPVALQLANWHSSPRPVLAYWFQQSLELRPPEWASRVLGSLFAELPQRPVPLEAGRLLLRTLLKLHGKGKGSRLRFVQEIRWLHQRRLLDVLAVSSPVYQSYFNSSGIPALLVPRGFHPDYGEMKNAERNIAAVWLGQPRTRSRARKIAWITEQLQQAGHEVRVHDGVRQPLIFGEQRTDLLNRTRFVLNLYADHPSNEQSIRYFITASNGAVNIAETGMSTYPFTPNRHIVECTVHEIPSRIIYYISHPDEWADIVVEMLHFVMAEATLEKSIDSILRAATAARKRQLPGRSGLVRSPSSRLLFDDAIRDSTSVHGRAFEAGVHQRYKVARRLRVGPRIV